MFTDIKMILSRPIIPRVLCLCLSILILWQVVMGVLLFRSSDKPIVLMDVPKSEKKIKPSLSNTKLSKAFFGEYVPENLNDASIKQSMLNLNIVGILFAEQENDSQVIIRTATGKEQIFRIGDTLPGGVILKRIMQTGVLVSRNGTLESLSLPKNELTFEPPAKPLIGE